MTASGIGLGGDPERIAPLSFGQERLWFLDQLNPGDLAFVRPLGLRLRGQLNCTALESSLGEVIRRHQMLRTTIASDGGTAHQVIHPFAGFTLPVEDLGDASSADAWRSQVEVATRQPFDLQRDPPFRPKLIRLANDDHVLLLTSHHIGFDGWSEAVLLRELAAGYAAAVEGRQADLPSLPMQVADYARWQRETADSPQMAAALDYWAEELAGGLNVGRLTVDSMAAEAPAAGVGESLRSLDEDLSREVHAVCAAAGATPFMLFSAALAALIGRLEASPTVTIGYPTAGRSRVEFEPLIGLFVNTLPLRVDLGGQDTFEAVLDQVRGKILNGLGHQLAPFERIVDRLQPPRDLDESPLFNVVVNMRNLPAADGEWPGLSVTRLDLPDLAVRYDLSLYVSEEEGCFNLRARYPGERQSDARISALMDQLVYLINQVTRDPNAPIRNASLVVPEHRDRLPDPSAPLPAPRLPTVLEMFTEQVDLAPDAIAVIDPEGRTSYRELLRLARAEAGGFREAGIEPGDVVALAGPPSLGRIVGLLAAFLCGAIAEPLDGRRSVAEQSAKLSAAGAKWVVSYGPTRDAAGYQPAGVPWLRRPARPAPGVSADSASEIEPAGPLPDPATIFFTSGSTGEAKAILGGQQALAFMLLWQRDTFGIGGGDRSAMINNLSFDISLRDILTPLISGAAVCIPDPVHDLDSGRVIAWLGRSGVTFVHLVPSIARYWLGIDGGQSKLDRLRLATLAGEPLTGDLVARLRTQATDDLEVVNLYGPTETTLVKTWYRVPAKPSAGVQPIGRPLPQTQVLVLDADGRPCGLNEPGELVIRTPHRSYGYVGRPEGNDGFVPNSATNDPADRLFRTGDVGQRRPDGLLEYLGRLDAQVKIHGVRVDLEEIESRIASEPGVAACALVPGSDERAGRLLTAYVVPTGPEVDLEQVRRAARAALPAQWLPTHWQLLPRLPLLANGKLDRSALADLPTPTGSSPQSNEAAQNEVERVLQRIWERSLNVGQVGVTDDYFDLGGHSLLALRIFADIEDQLGVSLPVSALFEAPTIRLLAERIQRNQGRAGASTVVAIQKTGRRPPAFWIHAAGGHVLSYQKLARQLGADQPFYAVQGEPPDGPADLRTVGQLAADYVEAIRAVQPSGPYYLGGLSFGGLVAYDMAQRLAADGEQVAFLGLLDTRNPAVDSGGRPLDLVYALRERFEFHRGQLALRPLGAWPGYLYERTRLMLGRAVASVLRRAAPTLARRLAPTAWAVELALWEADWARKRYRVERYPGRLTVFRASRQPRWSQDPALGWGDYPQAGIDVRPVPGTHVSIISGPNLSVLADEIRASLHQAHGANEWFVQ